MDRLNEQMNHRMEIVRQLREQGDVRYQPESYDEPIRFTSLKIRFFLTIVFMFFAFSMKTSQYNGFATKVITYFNHNSSVEVAVDNFTSDIAVFKNVITK